MIVWFLPMIGTIVENQNSGCRALDDGIYTLHLVIIQLQARVKQLKTKKGSFLYNQLRHFENRLRKLMKLRTDIISRKS